MTSTDLRSLASYHRLQAAQCAQDAAAATLPDQYEYQMQQANWAAFHEDAAVKLTALAEACATLRPLFLLVA